MSGKCKHRLLSVILCLILVLSVTLSAYAENEFAPEDSSSEVQEEFSVEASENQDSAEDFLVEEDVPEPQENAADETGSEDPFEVEAETEAGETAEPEPVATQSEAELIEPAEELFPAAESDEELVIGNEEAAIEQATVPSAGASGKCGSNAKWECYYDNTIGDYVLRITGSGGIKHYDDDNHAPWYNYYIKKIIIGKNITSIGRHAFSDQTFVRNVTFEGSNVTQICKYAFSNCYYLSSITIPSGVTLIGDYAFSSCPNLSIVSLPSTLTTIGSHAFYDCDSLSKIQIPTSVTSIGESALEYCKDIYFGKSASVWKSIGGNKAAPSDAVLHSVKSLSKAVVTLSNTSYHYTGKAIKPTVTVKLGSKTLKRGTDYQLSFKNNKSVGTATVTVKGIYGYSGSVQATFNIYRRSLADATVSGLKDRAYTGSAIKPTLTVKVKIGSSTLKLEKDKDYTVKFTNNKKLSTADSKAQVTITGKGNFKGTLKKTFNIVRRSISGAYVSGVADRYYTGKAVNLDLYVELTIGSNYVELKQGTDYILKYTNNTKTTTSDSPATVSICGKGNYKGTIKKTFQIVKRDNAGIVKRAKSWVGKAKYEYAACEPGKFDCSGFVSYCITGEYRSIGSSYDFCNLPRVSESDIQPGDIIARPGHVGIYIGNGQMAHAADEATGICIISVSQFKAVFPDMFYVREPGPIGPNEYLYWY